MSENQLPVHYTSAEETRRVRPAVDSGDAGMHIPRERATHVEARPANIYLADDLSHDVEDRLCVPQGRGEAAQGARGNFVRQLAGETLFHGFLRVAFLQTNFQSLAEP